MKKYEMELTEKEMILVLQHRQEEIEREEIRKEKNFFRKWIFNKHTFFDFKTAIIRELTKLIVTIYILNKFLANNS